MSDSTVQYSVIMPIGSRVDDIESLLNGYVSALKSIDGHFEIIAVLDGEKPELLRRLQDFTDTESCLRIFQFSRPFGESAALTAGLEEARGDIIITLPAYWQVEASEIATLVRAVTNDDDMLIGVRWPRAGSTFERIRRGVFHGTLRLVTGLNYRDLGCGVRLFRRVVADEIPLYADQHRFFPVLAVRRGFCVREIELRQSADDYFHGRYRLREYLHRFLDVLTVFFLIRFTKKPLRFFGSLGFLTAGFGAIFVLVLVIQRLFYSVPLGDRPALLLGSLLVVLGVQLFAIGLLGELVIFSHAADSKEYAVRSIVQKGNEADAAEKADTP
jgi:glycosyltransferase involved in cell wall biosynthesis